LNRAKEDQEKIIKMNANYKFALLKMKRLFSSNPIYRQVNQNNIHNQRENPSSENKME